MQEKSQNSSLSKSEVLRDSDLDSDYEQQLHKLAENIAVENIQSSITFYSSARSSRESFSDSPDGRRLSKKLIKGRSNSTASKVSWYSLPRVSSTTGFVVFLRGEIDREKKSKNFYFSLK